jgi:hypothetical protein
MPLSGLLPLLLAALLLCSFFPGFFVVRRLRWTPLEKLCGSVGLSLILIYLATWAVYCLGPRNERPAFWAVAAIAAALGAFSWRDAVKFFRSFRIRQVMLGFGFLLAWTFTMLLIIRVYSGATWSGDWYEHFQRSLFFLNRLPLNVKIIGEYALPARPPMQNVLAAFFMGLTSDRFELYQAIFAFLGVLLFFPCALLLPALGVNKRRRLIPLVVLFAASPVVMQNVTYSWTKALAAFYVILAICLYLAGWRKEDRTRTMAAFVALAAGMLVHYSAGPYIVFLGLHYLVRVVRWRRWRDVAVVALPAVILLAVWFGWSLKTYGRKATLASNTSVTSAAPGGSRNTVKILRNISDTIIPAWARNAVPKYDQKNAVGKLRDQAFTFYQMNLIFAMGAIGGPLVLWLLYLWLIRGAATPERTFWRILVPFCILVGIAVVGERDPLGVPHLTLLALEVAGLTLLAAAFPKLGRAFRLAIVVGCCIDFSLGVYLQAHVEGMENSPVAMVYPELSFRGREFLTVGSTPESLGENPWHNWWIKRRGELSERWLAELPRAHQGDRLFAYSWPQVRGILADAIHDDAVNWGAWGARHGGRVDFLGDWAAGLSGGGSDIASGVFLLMFAGCVVLLLRETMTTAHPVKAAPVRRPVTRAAARRARR